MKKENLERAIKIQDELKDIEDFIKSVKGALKDKNISFYISEEIDGSGFYINRLYYKGNYPTDLYQGILLDMLVRFEAHKKMLLKEIEEL